MQQQGPVIMNLFSPLRLIEGPSRSHIICAMVECSPPLLTGTAPGSARVQVAEDQDATKGPASVDKSLDKCLGAES